jgi:hypothetical protein
MLAWMSSTIDAKKMIGSGAKFPPSLFASAAALSATSLNCETLV